MSVESIARVLNLTADLTAAQKLCLVGIANHDGDGGAWPSIATLARYVGCSERHATRLVSELRDMGWVEVVANGGGTQHTRDDHRPNLYRLHLRRPVDNGTSRGDAQVTPSPVDNPDGVTSTSARGDAHVTRTVLEPSASNPPNGSGTRAASIALDVESIIEQAADIATRQATDHGRVTDPVAYRQSIAARLRANDWTRAGELADRSAAYHAATGSAIPGSVLACALLGDAHSLRYYPVPDDPSVTS
jgi:hypothetical protein